MTMLSSPTDAARTRVCTEHTFTSWDGTPLFYRAWPVSVATDRAIVLFHRGHEHSGRWQDFVDRLALDNYNIFAWDARGHGRSPGERGYADTFSAVVRDADAFARHLTQQHNIPLESMIVLGHSVGAVVAAAWIHDYAPPVRAMILGTPAFRVKLYIPFAVPALRWKLKLFKKKSFVKSYVKAGMLTHDVIQAAGYATDPLISRSIAVNILIDLFDASTRLLADAAAITTPTLILAAGSDWVVKNAAQKQFFERLSSSRKEYQLFPGFHHAIFHETQRDVVTARVRQFIENLDHNPPPPIDILQADRMGFTKVEYDALRRPLSMFSPRWWNYGAQKFFLSTIGRLSTGVRIGWRSGFDSGVSLDYIYENKPRGLSPLGKIIDYFYLNAIGWRGIRVRRKNLERLLNSTIQRAHRDERSVRILDIASGPGRYVLETMQQLHDIPMSATLRDYQQSNLDAARRLADQLDLSNVTFTHGDAFDRASLATMTPRPTIVITSGIYELFPDNAQVLRSLQGIADAMDEGGLLIYTCQPWHPQMEFIARVLVNREGQPWIMRRRTEAEMDALVCTAGFEKVQQDIDPWGIFTVCVARRVSR